MAPRQKAADPSSVLGYTKRVTERLTAFAGIDVEGAYLSVRFGNVLGSRGSVLETFRHQVDTGGPITVTQWQTFSSEREQHSCCGGRGRARRRRS